MQQRTLGIDLGIQSPSVAVVMDEQGEAVVGGLPFELSVEGLERVEQAAVREAAPGSKLHVVMEQTFPTYL